jgi:hypothetical protein
VVGSYTEVKQRKNDMGSYQAATSMIKNSEIPYFVRMVVPLILLSNTALLISGHLSLWISFIVELKLFGQAQFLLLQDNSFGGSIIDLWTIGARASAIMIAVAVGVLPYVKLLMTMCMWCFNLSLSRRGSILSWLDVLGKWTFVVVFYFAIAIAVFQSTMTNPESFHVPNTSLNVFAAQMWGFNAYVLAQIISQICGQVVLFYHHKLVSGDDQYESLPDIEMEPFRKYPSEKKQSSCTSPVMGTMSLVTILMVICVATFPLFNVKKLGIIGSAVKSENEYSLVGIFRLLLNQPGLTNAGLLLPSMLAITIVIAPIAQVLLILLTRSVPPPTKQPHQMTAFHVLSSWQFSEVFLSAILSAGLVLGPVSSYMNHELCPKLNPILAGMVKYGLVDSSQAICFSANFSLNAATYTLLVVVVVLKLSPHFQGKGATNSEKLSIQIESRSAEDD